MNELILFFLFISSYVQNHWFLVVFMFIVCVFISFEFIRLLIDFIEIIRIVIDGIIVHIVSIFCLSFIVLFVILFFIIVIIYIVIIYIVDMRMDCIHSCSRFIFSICGEFLEINLLFIIINKILFIEEF
jgi:hypothetical protein